jgi:hypothetical protein
MRCMRARRLRLGGFCTRIADRTRRNKIGPAPPIPQLQYVLHAAVCSWPRELTFVSHKSGFLIN